MITVGFRLLINSVVFINNMINPDGGSDTNVTNKQEDFYGSIDMDEPPSATNSAQLYLSGSTSEFDKVDIYINNTKAGSVTVKGTNSFHEKIGPLKSGENKIYAIARAGSDKSKQTDIYTVYYKKDPLKLEIETPTSDMKSNNQEIPIKGTTDPGSTLRVNGQPIVIDLQGQFQSVFRLKEGENNLIFTAQDAAGNIEEREIKVTYEKED